MLIPRKRAQEGAWKSDEAAENLSRVFLSFLTRRLVGYDGDGGSATFCSRGGFAGNVEGRYIQKHGR